MNDYRIFNFLLILLFAALNLACSDSSSLPEGWRLPTADEARDGWRDQSSDRYLTAKGDFNGDGIMDEAKLLVRKDGDAMGLFIFMSDERSFRVHSLDDPEEKALIGAMGIRSVPPGRYETACGKGYWECSGDELPEIELRFDGIDYFKTESANSLFYWQDEAKEFKRIWMSD